ncbi:MAG: hypothetical protein N2506_06400 [Dehalococcoidales bacterium]|nr:hypothetical protein [Dehalococcoidales bacterium]
MSGEILPGLKTRLLRLVRSPYFIAFAVLALGSAFSGLHNPFGIVLGWLAVGMLVVPVVRRWRKAWHFLALMAGCVLGAILISCLYSEVAVRLARWLGGEGALDNFAWAVFNTAICDLLLLTVPVGLAVGFAGFIILGLKEALARLPRRRTSPGT